jgi:aryl-alcohol dehydrogenase-like predicted oxidoreductase
VTKRKLGRSGLEIAPLVLGSNVFGWNVDEKTAFTVLDAFADAGFNAVDTADAYSTWAPGNKGGESETIIGNWIKARGNRDRVVIATKVGSEMGPGKKGLSKRYILEAAEASLKRLQTDYIDLYQSHWDDPPVPVEETLEAYRTLVDQGKVRVIGASNMTPERLEQSLAASDRLGLPRYETLQPPYNLYDRDPFEQDFQPICLREGLGVIPYYGLAAGFLTGKYRSEADFGKSVRGGSMAKRLNDRGRRILAALDEVGQRTGATPAQVALAWLMARPSVVAPIASATSAAQVAELVRAATLTLDSEATAVLDRASA